MSRTDPVVHEGGCHCGRVRFIVRAAPDLEVYECNCSICHKVGFLHLTVARDQLDLLSGADVLTTYRFNTGVAEHTFCSVCGIKPFYVPRSHPDGYSVNARCLDPRTIASQVVLPFDGANWEANVSALPPLPSDAE